MLNGSGCPGRFEKSLGNGSIVAIANLQAGTHIVLECCSLCISDREGSALLHLLTASRTMTAIFYIVARRVAHIAARLELSLPGHRKILCVP